jgi:uncharacterized membrane protein
VAETNGSPDPEENGGDAHPRISRLRAGARGAAEKAKPRRGVGDIAKDTIDEAKDTVSNGIPKPNKLARKLASRVIKMMVSRALESAARVVRAVVDETAEAGHQAVEKAGEKATEKRLPIQQSVDIAVPIRVAWDEWEALEMIPEGVHTVTDIERDGNELMGRTSRSTEWAAEILDEREQESFAWQSNEGSDCAGLITFHEISERLTRLELNLDVVPTSVGETAQLATHRADRKAEIDLRRFKARLELINPDSYPDEEPEEQESEGAESEDEQPTAEEPDAEAFDEEDEEPEAEEDAEPEDEFEEGEYSEEEYESVPDEDDELIEQEQAA